MGIFTAIVLPTANLLYLSISDGLHCGTVRTESVRYNHMRLSILFHKFLEENHCCLAVAALGNKGFQHFALVVDGTPQVMSFSIYLHENFVQMPSPFGVITGRRMKSFLPYFTCEQRTEPVPTIAHSLVANVDAALIKKVFNIAKRKGKPDLHHHSQADDFR
nr:hypothetical protein [uncultured Sneathiella sp.]